MTVKRNLKRRVRERQARTGESYMTARRQVLAARDAARQRDSARIAAPTAAPAEARPEPTAATVVEPVDVSAAAARLGFCCPIAMLPDLQDRAEPAILLADLRDALIAAPGNPATVRMFDVAFGVRATARVGKPGLGITFLVAGRDVRVPFLCVLWDTGLMLMEVDGRMEVDPARTAVPWQPVQSPPVMEEPTRPGVSLRTVFADTVRFSRGPFADHAGTIEVVELDEQIKIADPDEPAAKASWSLRARPVSIVLPVTHVENTAPMLFVIYAGRRHRIAARQFIIGRGRKTCDLWINHQRVSRKHAAVIQRNAAYYIKDLGSTNGVFYRGMRIDNKRIDEGDVFLIGDHELRFTFAAATDG